MISMDMLRDAQRVLGPVINRTPVVPTKGCLLYTSNMGAFTSTIPSTR